MKPHEEVDATFAAVLEAVDKVMEAARREYPGPDKHQIRRRVVDALVDAVYTRAVAGNPKS